MRAVLDTNILVTASPKAGVARALLAGSGERLVVQSES